MLNALRQNGSNRVSLTNDIGNGDFNEARREGHDALISQTGDVL
jgi:hypothetical protein